MQVLIPILGSARSSLASMYDQVVMLEDSRSSIVSQTSQYGIASRCTSIVRSWIMIKV